MQMYCLAYHCTDKRKPWMTKTRDITEALVAYNRK